MKYRVKQKELFYILQRKVECIGFHVWLTVKHKVDGPMGPYMTPILFGHTEGAVNHAEYLEQTRKMIKKSNNKIVKEFEL